MKLTVFLKWVLTICLPLALLYGFESVAQDNDEIAQLKQKVERLKEAEKEDELNKALLALASAFYKANDINGSVKTYREVIALNKQIGNDNAIAYAHSQIGNMLSEDGSLAEAIGSYEEAVSIRRKIRDNQGLSVLLLTLGIVQKELGRYDESIKNISEALELSRALNYKYAVTDCFRTLAEVYEKKGDKENALLFQKKYADSQKIEEMLAKEEMKKEHQIEQAVKDQKISTLNSAFDSASKINEQALLIALNKAKEVKMLEEKRKLQELTVREQDSRINTHKILINTFIGGGSLVLILSVLLAIGYVQMTKTKKNLAIKNEEIISQKDELEESSKKLKLAFSDIQSSINYAKKIQMAMMPSESSMQKVLEESFVYLKPRDVVSGDFYWKSEKDGKVIIAAVDCTGHGVPGAFMSMIGSNVLNQIVNEKGITEPDEILNLLGKRIKYALNQEETDNKDGMDIALCVIDTENQQLSFAGAKNPLVLVKNNSLEVVKGDKMSIGGKLKNGDFKFTKHKIEIDEPVTCYIFSDGFQDQFGGKMKKKYMTVRFRELLERTSKKPISEQKVLLDNELTNWMDEGGEEQIDDILVVGFKLDLTDQKAS